MIERKEIFKEETGKRHHPTHRTDQRRNHSFGLRSVPSTLLRTRERCGGLAQCGENAEPRNCRRSAKNAGRSDRSRLIKLL